MKTKKTPLYILLVYIALQLSSIIIIYPMKNVITMLYPDATSSEIKLTTMGWTSVLSFTIGFLIVLLLILRDKGFFNKVFKGTKSSVPSAILWGVFGFVFLLVGQSIAGAIEQALGIKVGSENTNLNLLIAKNSPVFVLIIVFVGPFLEEVVFRRIIFGSLYQKMNFFIAAIISAIIFGAIHLEFEHLLIYATTGLILAFLYKKTKRLLTTIIAHVMLNGFITLIQLYAEPIQNWLNTVSQFIHFH